MSWSWLSSDPVECFQSPEVQLLYYSSLIIASQRTLIFYSPSRNNSLEFNTTDLACNTMYVPRVRATLKARSDIQLFEDGSSIFFGGIHKWLIIYSCMLCYQASMSATLGSESSPPAVLPRVCVGPSTSPQHQGRVNISWDPLPCHLQNGADVTSYIMQYTRLSTGVTRRITSYHSDVECSQEVGGLYSCVVAESLIQNNDIYSIQVTAQNNYGEGSYSDPVNVSLPVSSRCYST